MDIVKHIEQKFDDTDVVQITSDEWFALRDLILILRKENEQLKWTLKTQD